MLCALSPPVTEATEGGLKLLVGLMVKCSCPMLLIINNSIELVAWLGLLASGFWNSKDVFSGSGCCLLWLLLLSLWHVCGGGIGVLRKCRLLWLMVLFLCPALYLT